MLSLSIAYWNTAIPHRLLLERLAGGVAEARRTREAKGALKRLDRLTAPK
jgi:hypothetical protein